MSEYKLDVNGSVNLVDYSCINDYVGFLGNSDKLTIAMENFKFENAEIITNILKRKKFIITENGEKEDGKYYIRAFRDN